MDDTEPTDPASSHQNASVDEADARFLRWVEERLAGAYEDCRLCQGDGWDPYTELKCAECRGTGKCLRDDYIMAEHALTDAQRAQIGEENLELGRDALSVVFQDNQ